MDIGASNWNEDDASNNQTPPDGFPEGMAPSGVNNAARAIMGALKRAYNWSSPKTTGGTATAYTLTYGVPPGAYVDGMTFMVQFHAPNGAAATLNVNLLGAKPLHYHAAGAWRVAPPGLLDTDEVFRVAYHDATGASRLVGFRNKTGVTEEFAGSVAPAGAVFCNGAAISRTDYAGLFAVLGTSHGAGNGTTTFNVPDHQGRVVAGPTGATGRLPGFTAPGVAGGTTSHAHNVSVSVSGSVSLSGTTFTENAGPLFCGAGSAQVAFGGHTHNFNASGGFSGSGGGGTDAQTIVQPTIVENKIIRI